MNPKTGLPYEPQMVPRGDYARVRRGYGVRSPAHLAWRSDFAQWARDGVEVVPTVTAPDAQWTGCVGRVQEHLGAVRGSTFAFLCGQQQMTHEVTAALVSQGLPASRVFLNH